MTGLPLEEPMLEALERAGYRERADPVFLQSFESANLRALRAMTGLRLVQLLAGPPYDLAAIAGYADGIGPAKTPLNAAFVAEAHAAGLLVHPWTYRREEGDLGVELPGAFDLGVDGVFCDHPDIAVIVRDTWTEARA